MIKERARPKVFIHHTIKIKDNPVGWIQLVNYMCGKCTPHIEYEIFEEYRGLGIMSKELPRYIKRCAKQYNIFQFVALVHPQNSASINLLESNDFLFAGEVAGMLTFMKDSRFDMAAVRAHLQNHELTREESRIAREVLKRIKLKEQSGGRIKAPPLKRKQLKTKKEK